MPTLPKISYVLLSHNREKYIRAALESAFAQDYEGELEYIISDDCSTDRTFEIIQECVANYKGSRRVVVTQTPQNCHLAGNTNHALQFVESDWIVRADDDDLSSVDRCSIIGRAIAEHPEATFVVTGMRKFTDEEEAEVQEASLLPCGKEVVVTEKDTRKERMKKPGFDCHHYSFKAWNMKSFRIFGHLDRQAYYVDDYTFYLRSCILGSGLYVANAPAVFMRIGSYNMCRGGDDNSNGYRAIMRQEQFNDRYHNLTLAPLTETCRQLREYAAHRLSPEQQRHAEPFLQELEQNLQMRRMLCTYWRGSTLNRIRIARKLGWKGLFAMLRCLPMPVFAACLAVYRHLFKKG